MELDLSAGGAGYPETGASAIKTAESTKNIKIAKFAGLTKKLRQERLARIIEGNPMATDRELAATLGVSVSTVRLDRALMGVPELRERVRCMAQQANSKLRSLSRSEIVSTFLSLRPLTEP